MATRASPPLNGNGGTTKNCKGPQLLLNESYKAEIREAFDVFDADRTGRISPNSLKMLLRALGYRATREEIASELETLGLGRESGGERSAIEERGGEYGGDDDDQAAMVDIEAAYAVVARKRATQDPNVELKMNFRLFTDTDHITEDNLRQVALELGDDDLADGVGRDQIRAMIEVFDADLDGKISFAEFRRIMAPSS